MLDRKLLNHFDWGLLGSTILLGLIGIVVLYSAIHAGGASDQESLVFKQIVWFVGGILIIGIIGLIDYRQFDEWGLFIYAGGILLLIGVMFFGHVGGGARRWLLIGPFTFQPSELMKIAICIALARYYSRHLTVNGLELRDLIQPFILILIPFILIVEQPDLGTALICVIIGGTITLFVGLTKKTFFSLVAAGCVVVPLIWRFLKDYQKDRILTFLDPDRDPLGKGYNIIQSKIAIGSGELSGKGFLEGTQNALDFLPEHHTDFILSVLAEEWGFLGSSLLLVAYLLFFAMGLNVAFRCRDLFGVFLAVGITCMNFWHVFINMGMVMGLLPVVGMPLPMISYGGSSVITTLIGVGILLNISMRSYIQD